eukprot:TRINITY_DN665_c0_g2_i1.p1 TRINITY_DN665_c0_g2~~TRINITY_DN665_c0_g2_i1.p1  ORF type:complete len:537 (+),score=103.49 TRINITY_DN665_c0_g2_i1:48-1658(+)
MEDIWKHNILGQLKAQNILLHYSFVDIIHQSKSLVHNEVKMKSENEKLKTVYNLSKSQISSNSTVISREVEEELRRLQEELNSSYLKVSEGAMQIVDLNKQLNSERAEKEDLISKHEELIQINALLEENANRLDREYIRKESDLTLLREELQQLQIELAKSEDALQDSFKDQKKQQEGWLEKVRKHAEQMNEMNEIMIELQSVREELSKYQNGPQIPTDSIPANLITSDPSVTVSAEIPRTVKSTLQNKGDVNVVAFSEDGSFFATGGSDRVVRLYESFSGSLKTQLSGCERAITCIKFSPDNEFILAASTDRAVRIWSVSMGRVRHSLQGHLGKVYAAAFSFDSQKVITGSHDRKIKIWDLQKGYCIRTVFCYSSVNDLCLSNDGGLIVAGHVDNRLRFFDSRNGDCVHEISDIHSGQITSVTLSPDGTHVLTNSRDNTLKLIDIRTFETENTYGHTEYKNGMNWTRATLSPDGRYIATGSEDGKIYIWDRFTGVLHTTLNSVHKSNVNCVAWNPTHGNQLISCDRNGNVVIWTD